MRIALLLAVGTMVAACDPVDRPNRPLPEQFFEATTLEGQRIDPAFLRGKPWVINLWIPD